MANNSDSAGYLSGLSGYVASGANQANNPKGFTGQLTVDASKMQYQGFVEPRIAYKQLMIGFSLGYATFQQISAKVSSPNYSNALSLSLNGYFIPAIAIFYYRIALLENLSLNFGLGGGAMYTSIKYVEDDTLTSNSQRYTAWNAVVMVKPELEYKIGRLAIMFSIPFYVAESRKVEFGSTALVNGDTGKVISPNLSGVGFSIGIGYKLQ